MADLQQILSAIMRDISKSRFSSDLYSRSIARYYENDYLLSKFPIPRTEIEEVELDLKFSVSEINPHAVNGEGKEANLAFALERTTEKMVSSFLDLALEFSDQEDNKAFIQKLYEIVNIGFNSSSLRVEMRQYLLRYFIESYPHLISKQGYFDIEMARKKIVRPIILSFYQFKRESAEVTVGEFISMLHPLCERALAHKEFTEALSSLQDPIEVIWQRSNDVRLDVVVSGDVLQELKDSAISSIRVKASVRNHQWSEVKTGKHTSNKVLTSE